MPLWARLWLLAQSRADLIGHAQFAEGELYDLMKRRVNRTSGEVSECSRGAVSHAVKQCVEYGLLARESRAQCLVLPSSLVQKEGRGSRRCITHQITGA